MVAVAVKIQTTMVEIPALEEAEVLAEPVVETFQEAAVDSTFLVAEAVMVPPVVVVVVPARIVSTRIIPTTKVTTLANATKSPTFPGRNTRTWTNPILVSLRLPMTTAFVDFRNPMPIRCVVNRRENREQFGGFHRLLYDLAADELAGTQDVGIDVNL